MDLHKKNPNFFNSDFHSCHIQLLRLLANVSQNTTIHVENVTVNCIRGM